MNGVWTRAWLVSLFLAAPGYAVAQSDGETVEQAEVIPAKAEDEAPTGEQEAKAEEAKAEDADAEKPDGEAAVAPAGAPAAAAPAGDAPAAEEVAEEEEEEEVVEDPAAPAAAPGAAPADGKPVKKKKKDATGNAAALGAVALALQEPTKPWTVFLTLSQSIGAGAFVVEPTARQPAYSWSLSALGTYNLGKFNDGRLLAFSRISVDQQLTNTFVTDWGGTREREFYVRDLQMGVTGPGLFHEKEYLDTRFGGSFSFFLPTSKIAQATQRALRLQFGPNLLKVFGNVGPGSLVVTFSELFRKDIGPRLPTDTTLTSMCDSASAANDRGECYIQFPGLNFALMHTLGANYTIGPVTLNLSWTIFNMFMYDRSNSNTDNLRNVTADMIDSSQNAHDGVDHRMWSFASLSAIYTFNANWSTTLGMTTFNPSPFIQRGNNPRGIRFPFFDFDSTARNLSTFFLDVNFIY